MTTNPSRLECFLRLTTYIVPVDFGGVGIGSADMTTDFGEACDRYAEARNDDRDAKVLEVSTTHHAVNDVTAAALHRIAQIMVQRGQDLPDWLAKDEAIVPMQAYVSEAA